MTGPLRLPLFATVVLALAWMMWSLWTALEADRKTAGLVRPDGKGVADVMIVLKFPPEAFHLNRAQQIGQLVRTQEERLFLRNASLEATRAYARAPWVRTVEPWDGD